MYQVRFSSKFAFVFLFSSLFVSEIFAYPVQEIRSVETSREKKIRELRDAEVNQIRIALGRRLPKNRKAELYFRLAEVYLEGYRSTFLLEGRVHEKRLKDGRKSRRINRDQSKVFLRKGIKASESLLALKIPYEKLDHVYYFLAFNSEELGNRKSAKKYYSLLLKKFPRSRFSVEAYREMGNESYSKKKYRDAIKHYEKALRKEKQVRDLGILPEVLYRLSWSYYRTRQYSKAVRVMKRAVKESQKEDEKYLSIYDEALEALAIFMTESERTSDAIQYFKSLSGGMKKYLQILKKLGDEYHRNLKIKKATQVYEAILKADSNSDVQFEVAVKLIELDVKRRRHKSAIKRLSNTEVKKSGSDLVTVQFKRLKSMIRRTATEFHNKYRKNKKRKNLIEARRYYEAYLDNIISPDSKEGIEIRMYLADVNQSLGNLDQAAGIYQGILETKDKRYAKEAGALWVQSLWEAIQKTKKKKSSRRDEPSELEKKFVTASDRVQKIVPESNEAKQSELKSAQILAGYSKTKKQAIQRINRIIENRPQSQDALVSGRLLIQIREDRLPNPKKANAEKYLENAEILQETVMKLEENSALMSFDKRKGKSRIKKKIDQVKRDLRIGSILVYESNKDFEKAAAAYENFAVQSKSKKVAENAYLNALDAYLRNKDFSEAQRLVYAWEKRFPKSKKAIQSVRTVATQFLILGEYERSANLFTYLGKKGNDSEALMTALRIHESLNEDSKMLESYSHFRKIYSKSKNRFGLILKMGRYFSLKGNVNRALDSFRECQSGPAIISAECGARLGDELIKVDDTVGAKKVYDRVAFRLGKKASSSPFVGYARYQLALQLENSVEFEELSLPEQKLQKALQERLKFFEKLSRVHKKAAEAGGPWAIASLGRIARWTLNFADDVDGIEPPKNVPQKEIERFKKTLKSVSQPLRKKAIQSLRTAYSRAVKERHLTSATIGITHDLSEFHDRLVAPAQGHLWGFQFSGGLASEKITSVRKKLVEKPKSSTLWVNYGVSLIEKGNVKFAQIAFQRALSLNKNSPSAMNNLAVIKLNQDPSDWLNAFEAKNYLRKAFTLRGSGRVIDWNIAVLYGYYRLYAPALKLWEKLLSQKRSKENYQGAAMMRIGLRRVSAFESASRAALKVNGTESPFSQYYGNAVSRFMNKTSESMEKCLDSLSDISKSDLIGFEVRAYQRLKRTCQSWKTRLKK